MPRELIVDLPCRVKHELGNRDLRNGSRKLVNLLHARERINLIRSRPRQDGVPIGDVRIRLPVLTESGREELEASVSELDTETKQLDPLEPYCTNCPANAHRRSFGCVGGLPYPVSKAVEQYALDRTAEPNRIGGALLLQTLAEQGITGSLSRDYRAESKFEAMSGPVRKLPENAFGKKSLSSDELFEPLLISNGTLPPWMSLNVLLWFEAIVLDDREPATVNDILVLTRMDPPERPKRTKSHLGPPSPGGNAEAFRGLLKLLYVGWSRDLPVMIES